MGYLTISTDVRRCLTHHRWHFFFQEDWCTCIGREYSPTAAALWAYFLLDHVPNSPKLNALTTRFRESYTSVITSRESKRLKKSRIDWLNSGNALIQHLSEKCIFRFSGLPGSAEAHINWCGIIKCLLIAYFIGNISAKKYQNAVSKL